MFVAVYLGSSRIVVPASGILSGTLLYGFAEVDGGAERLSAAISHKIVDPAVVALCSPPNVSAELIRLETPTVVWNSECRHMLGVVLRELEGATPGLQDVPAIEVHEVCTECTAILNL